MAKVARYALQQWRARIALVERSTALRVYGACLAAVHIFTFVYWMAGGFIARILTERSPVCWPFFEDCAQARGFSRHTVWLWMIAYLVLAIAATLAFARRRWVRFAIPLLAITNLAKTALFVLDYRLMGNYHYMPFVITFLYLAWPRPQHAIPYMLVAFYVSAGALKLGREWLSGAALIAPTWLSGKLLEIACAYVVVLELVLVLGLLSRSRLIRTAVFAQLVMFHAYSWHVVGFFYPCVMGLLLAFFPLRWREVPEETERAGWPVAVIVLVFALAQAAPRFFPGDSAITGEGRIFALNMMDARVECDQFQLVREGNVIRETSELHANVGVRIKCDPIRFWNIARALCDDADRVDVYLNSRRTTDPQYHPVFAVEDFCRRAPHFDVWRHNDWLEPSPLSRAVDSEQR